MDWQITVGEYALALLERVEVHKSVDLLADTCTITLPGAAYNKAYRVEQQIKRGDKVTVKLGQSRELFPDKFRTEFQGYLLNVSTDNDSLTLVCEDDLFLMRVAVGDKQFKSKSVADIAQYLLDQSGAALELDCNLGITYDKFVISKATAYDVLKKIKEETKASIYLKDGKLHIHAPYLDSNGLVRYSFQHNIEKSELKYIRKEDKKVEVIISSTSPDGKKLEKRFGTTGGDQQTFDGYGLSADSMQKLAEDKYRVLMTDGYDGDITTWLEPYVEPGMSAEVRDEDYEFKNGRYYVNAVTTTFDNNGDVRKVQLGIKLGGNG